MREKQCQNNAPIEAIESEDKKLSDNEKAELIALYLEYICGKPMKTEEKKEGY
jgi:hypothetical protein